MITVKSLALSSSPDRHMVCLRVEDDQLPVLRANSSKVLNDLVDLLLVHQVETLFNREQHPICRWRLGSRAANYLSRSPTSKPPSPKISAAWT